MTRRRWIADEFSANHAVLTGAHAAHLARTLRARVGQEFEVACGEKVYRATVSIVADDRVEFTLGEEVASRDVVPVTLLLAIFKFDRMEWAIEKCTELNVTEIIPVIARRTERHLAQVAAKRVERWRRIAREAAEQSRRATPPEITPPVKMKDVLWIQEPRNEGLVVLSEGIDETRKNEPRGGGLEVGPGRKPGVGLLSGGLSPVATAQNDGEVGQVEDSSHGLKIVLAENERDLMLADVLRAYSEVRSLTLAVGPEGGWAPEELRSFSAAQFVACSLGDTILRAETAAIAALVIARAEIQ